MKRWPPNPRFVVSEVEGYFVPRTSGGAPGLSTMVLDAAYNFKQLRTWRSESGGTSTTAGNILRVRADADAYAAKLNAEWDAYLAQTESREATREDSSAAKGSVT